MPLLLYFGAPTNWAALPDLQQLIGQHPRGVDLLQIIHQKQALLRDAWLTETGHQRPGLNKGLPLAEAQARAAKLDARASELVGSDRGSASPH